LKGQFIKCPNKEKLKQEKNNNNAHTKNTSKDKGK